MGEKKSKISLATVICIVIIFILALAIIYVCVQFSKEKVEDKKKIDQLTTNLDTMQDANGKLQGTVDELQDKIDQINDTINDGKTDKKNPEPLATPSDTPANDKNSDKKENSQESNEVTEDEIAEIESFINDRENYAFTYVGYNNPVECITNESVVAINPVKNTTLLRYSIISSKYCESLIDTDLEKAQLDGFSISVNNLQKYLKEKLNYNFSENEIKENFNYDEKSGKIAYIVSDALFDGEATVTNVEKKDGKYIVNVNRGNSKIIVTLTKENDNYYFYACEKM